MNDNKMTPLTNANGLNLKTGQLLEIIRTVEETEVMVFHQEA